MTRSTSLQRLPLHFLLLFAMIVPAVQAATFTVTSTADSGAGSLRAAVASAGVAAGADTIVFDPAVFNGEAGDAILVTSRIIVNDASGLTIDAMNIPQGVVVSGRTANRILEVQGTAGLVVKGLTFVDGRGLAIGQSGGAIVVSGVAGFQDCAIRNCISATGGGAVYSTGTLLMERCSITGSIAPTGGGIHAAGGSLDLRQCTLSGNGSNNGGAVAVTGTTVAAFTFCTVSGNYGTAGPTQGGGLLLQSTAATGLMYCIVAGNSAQTGADISKGAGLPALTLVAPNLIGDNATAETDFPSGQPNAQGTYAGTRTTPVAAMLAPLAGYGGRTETMPPRLGSLALDKIASPLVNYPTDQRGVGFSRKQFSAVDIGAVESAGLGGCAWETVELFSDTGTVPTLAAAEALTANGQAAGVHALGGVRRVLNLIDPNGSSGATSAGYFPGEEAFTCNDLTPSGLTAGGDDNFTLLARCRIRITAEDDYTFGFSGDDGARLRIYAADGTAAPQFISSTRLNTNNPANPAHTGNTLQFPGTTPNSDTLGVVHLLAGEYSLEFLTWEASGAAHAEVFAARGAQTAITADFRLVGDDSGPWMTPSITDNWRVDVIRRGVASMTEAVSLVQEWWCGRHELKALRFCTANDGPERDPMNFILEGSDSSLTGGPWTAIRSGLTRLPEERFTWGPVIQLTNAVNYRHYRVSFRNLRDPAEYTMQIGEVELLDASGNDITREGDAVVASRNSSPQGEGVANAIDGDVRTKFLLFIDVAGLPGGREGFSVTPRGATLADSTGVTQAQTPSIAFHDPAAPASLPGNVTPVPFPGGTGTAEDAFALGARATLNVPETGEYTFCVHADNTARLRIPGSSGWTVSDSGVTALTDGFTAGTASVSALGTVWLRAGQWPIELIYHELSGNAGVALWAAAGRMPDFNGRNTRYFSLLSATPTSGAAPAIAIVDAAGNAARPANDDFTKASVLSGFNPSAQVCVEKATLEPGEPTATPDDPAAMTHSVWYSWTPPAPGRYVITTSGTELDTALAVYTGDALNALTPLAASSWGTDYRASLSFSAVPGTVYRIQAGLYSAGDATGSIVRLQMTKAPAQPAWDNMSQPQSLGSSVSGSFAYDTNSATSQAGEPAGRDDGLAAFNTLWFSWTAPWTGEFTFDTDGSNFDTILSIYAGTPPALALLGWNDDHEDTYKNDSRVVITAQAGMTYRLQAGGYDTNSRGRLLLNIHATPALIGGQIHNTPAGEVITLSWNSTPGLPVRVLSSSDLQQWSDAANCTPAETTRTDLDITGLPARQFFRVLPE